VERETILLVEDEAFVREVTGEVLRSAGYRVVSARNAAEAAHAYDERGGEVELLLSDVVLPGETGRALAGRLRGANPRLKVLLVTGYAQHIGGREVGEEECLAKPFSTDALLRRVREIIDREVVAGEVMAAEGSLGESSLGENSLGESSGGELRTGNGAQVRRACDPA